jgi:DNA-binding Lrp family transcriptional regulator
MRSRAAEARLLASIAERGIEQPLEGVDTPQGRFLLNGFKRCRCAGKLGISCVPYTSLGDEEAMGIVALMRVAKDQTLNLLEEAKFISELLTVHRMSPAEIAEKLGRSKGWVGMRRNLLEEMSLFEHERLYLNPLPEHLPAPYQTHHRVTDQYGYVAFAANYYRVPGTGRDEVKVFQYAERLKIFRHYECLAEYPLPPAGTRHRHYSPPGQPKPRHQPKNRHRHAKLEEQRLRA